MRFVAMSLSIMMLSPVMASRALANEPSSQTTHTQKISTTSRAKSTTASAQAAKAGELTPAEKDLLAQGYKLRVVDGQRRFCRRQTVLGSNLERMVCTTGAQAAESQQTGRAITEQIQRNQANPNGH